MKQRQKLYRRITQMGKISIGIEKLNIPVMTIFLWRLPLPMYKYSLPDGHACCLYKDEKENMYASNDN